MSEDAVLAGCARRIRSLERNNVENAFKIGLELDKAHRVCAHGEFQDWIKREFGWSYETCNRYRRLARLAEICHTDTFEHFNISLSALHYLAALDDGAAAVAALEAARTQRVTRRIAEQMVAGGMSAEVAEPEAEETPAEEAEKPVPAEEPEPSTPRSRRAPTLRWLRDALKLTDEQWRAEVAGFGGADNVSALLSALADKHRALFEVDAVKAAADRAEIKSRKLAA